ncbi:DUF4832 domain-containing protein [uncultured Paraglaciecola sp.]|uniref:DUF4832 domain-containing protein n=1 Tax=uncultured Paraglaciecola sp. TaxID=1765024 RepID=UPI0030D94E7B|tara:strand:- start:201280 stop:203502 length:2223 start_codon:yes stop_codon:yes gene_type:complete
MKNANSILALSLLLTTLVACGGGGSGQKADIDAPIAPVPEPIPEPIPSTEPETEPLAGFTVIKKQYLKSDEDIANPGRGFYQHTETQTSSFSPLSKAELIANRNDYQASDGSYSVKSTIILRAFILDNYVNNPILSNQTLTNIQGDFDIARAAGIKMIVRFYYHKNSTAPYGDPEKEVILAHIQQLKPILTANADVILALQQGFIGAWGEQYYTDNFSPAGDVTASYTQQNWIDRNEVITALLTAIDAQTMLQVRTPQAKQKFIYGADAAITSGLNGTPGSLTADNAFSGQDIARVGFHNDCFLTDASDTGTYADYGTAGGTKKGNAIGIFKNYHKNDSQFVLVGGETCKDESWATPPEPYANDCSDNVVNTMDELNYSYLNADYNNSVNNDWTEGANACMEEIKNKLGYRFSMTSSTAVMTAKAGNYIPFLLTINNEGFTSPVTPMEIRLILKHQVTAAETTIVLDVTRNDIRTWQPGTTELGEYIKLPDDLAIGDYDLSIHIADMSNNGAIAARPEYSMQLANIDTWDATSGYNNLAQTISVEPFMAGDVKNTQPTEPLITVPEPTTPAEPSMVNISIDGDTSDWDNVPLLASAENQQALSLKVTDDETYLYVAIVGIGMGPHFDLFINTDGDSATGFQSFDWPLSGADYLIQQDTVGVINLHKSTGSDWSWQQQTTTSIEANSTNQFVELKIEKANFEGMNASISFGLNDIDAQWQVQSRLPLTSEVMAPYTLSAVE